MITPDQEKWLKHISDTKKVRILPYNPKVKETFQKIKQHLQSILGKEVEIVHRGASNLGISGKGEIDMYIPVEKDQFVPILKKLKEEYGKPDSLYPNERSRFNFRIDDIDIELFLINKESDGWRKGNQFEEYLKNNTDALKEYMKIKEESEGVTTREYYRRKLEFMNKIFDQIAKE
jgi:GrpB-like predicted nucleotidyltransferase (UPF0157 family)